MVGGLPESIFLCSYPLPRQWWGWIPSTGYHGYGQPFTCVLSTQIQVFMLAQCALYQLRYLHSPSPVVKILNNT